MENHGLPPSYWLQWQVLVCGLIILLPSVTALVLIRRRRNTNGNSLKSTQLWLPCWRNLHPGWLLVYRAFAFLSMAFFLYQIVHAFGFFVFFFYTQWTFALVTVYFALATFVSARGCWTNSRNFLIPSEETAKLIKKDSDKRSEDFKDSKHKETSQVLIEQQAEFLENLMQNIYQMLRSNNTLYYFLGAIKMNWLMIPACAGAVVLTDIVFWCLLLPFMAGEQFKLTLLIAAMHSVNAVFLILDSALNSLSFSWFSMTYFVLWSCSYMVFQWALHACCFEWWPYPFLDLSTPWAPMWYLALALVHVPCFGLYLWLVRGKDWIFSRMFSSAYIRTPAEKEKTK